MQQNFLTISSFFHSLLRMTVNILMKLRKNEPFFFSNEKYNCVSAWLHTKYILWWNLQRKKCWVFMGCGRNVDIIEFKFAACAFVSVCAQSAKFHLIKSRNLHTHTHTLASFILSLFSIWVDCGMSGKNAEKKAYCNL